MHDARQDLAQSLCLDFGLGEWILSHKVAGSCPQGIKLHRLESVRRYNKTLGVSLWANYAEATRHRLFRSAKVPLDKYNADLMLGRSFHGDLAACICASTPVSLCPPASS